MIEGRRRRKKSLPALLPQKPPEPKLPFCKSFLLMKSLCLICKNCKGLLTCFAWHLQLWSLCMGCLRVKLTFASFREYLCGKLALEWKWPKPAKLYFSEVEEVGKIGSLPFKVSVLTLHCGSCLANLAAFILICCVFAEHLDVGHLWFVLRALHALFCNNREQKMVLINKVFQNFRYSRYFQ